MGRPRRTRQTPSQTVGPFFGMALGREGDEVLVDDDTPGERIRLEGRLLDGNGDPVEDGLVELWQADASGRYRHPLDDWDPPPSTGDARGFTGFGRCPTAFETGAWAFDTIRPGAVADPAGGMQAPHLNLVVQARGMLDALFTRVYLDDEPANEADRVLQSVPAERRATLVATRQDGDDPPTFVLDLHLQGPDETVFLDV
ncbi:protocatechuate 3,4-dioxygenase subunit alpha [Salsipaludibacter albus]|uniref:protocatechuate 3,4-dioxygenase subunit alpha n=1 Tax=Salsipaludibacter albus TaxID=2849650 RepID=UPI001EE3F683|nr:protocatechuate 3,4-dioxygenase subunit alpha [Salsipaludibacter albus]MBY5164254.1 protocatechuate 3,4-dioxygenase subunit alpha [Salsipaludibacter albus]